MTEKFLKRHRLQCPPSELDVCDLIKRLDFGQIGHSRHLTIPSLAVSVETMKRNRVPRAVVLVQVLQLISAVAVAQAIRSVTSDSRTELHSGRSV
jgi:hypothetical protein